MVLKDFYNFHIVQKRQNRYYTNIKGDHATTIRLYFLERFLKSFLELKDEEGMLVVKSLIIQDLLNLQRPSMYRKGHNHGIMSDSVLMYFALKKDFRASVDIVPIIKRSLKTFYHMWYKNGETTEHSLTYQEFNLGESIRYIRYLKEIFKTYPFSFVEKLRLLLTKKDIDFHILVSQTRKLCGFMLRSDETYFPLGDSTREPIKSILYSHINKNASSITQALEPFSKEHGLYFTPRFVAFRNETLHFASTCQHFSNSHKQNDEFHFCLDINQECIFDDCGHADFTNAETAELMSCEKTHSTITISNIEYSPKKFSNFNSKINSANINDEVLEVIMQHQRINHVKMQRIFLLDTKNISLHIQNHIEIFDMNLIHEDLEFRFVLSPSIVFEIFNENLVRLRSEQQNYYLKCVDDLCYSVDSQTIPYLASYPNLQTTNMLIFKKHISSSKEKLDFIFYKDMNDEVIS
ncbi:hypothetical protein DMB92_08940 [Campylobacter sp. MIT 99-7217]|nr:hypothetical protein DMB92_08940 [Campylobacter sp. MIT 99-7217]